MMPLRVPLSVLLCAGLVIGCAAASVPARSPGPSVVATAPASPAVSSTVASATPAGSADPGSTALPSGDLPDLREGGAGPGRYVLTPPAIGWGECVMGPDCPPEPPHARTLRLEITIPDGWEAPPDSDVIHPEGPGSSEGPDGAALIIGWSNRAGLHSDPCLPAEYEAPDIAVGPTVEDLVDAIRAHPLLEVSEPVDVELGGYRGRFLTLTAPSDISRCDSWRPWEPGIYAQGPGNIWNLWIIDVDGLRMVLLAQEFPGTPAEDKAELREMVESIRFLP